MQNPIEISQKHGFWIQACKSAKKIEIGTNDLSKSCPGSVQEDKSLLVGSSCPSLLFLRDGHLSDSVLNQINACKANIKVVHRICILGYKIRILTCILYFGMKPWKWISRRDWKMLIWLYVSNYGFKVKRRSAQRGGTARTTRWCTRRS